MRKFLLGGVALATVATGAQATVNVSSTAYALAAPAGASVVIDFDDPSFAGFSLSGAGYLIQSGNNSQGAAPAAGPTDASDDATKYLSIYGGWAKLMGTVGYHGASLYWGSIDGYNAVDLLDAGGNVFDTITAATIASGSNGDQLAGNTNRRVDIASTQAIYGLQFRSTSAALETDNVAFSGPVPEPTSWAMMLGGFGALGTMMRSRKKASPAFA